MEKEITATDQVSDWRESKEMQAEIDSFLLKKEEKKALSSDQREDCRANHGTLHAHVAGKGTCYGKCKLRSKIAFLTSVLTTIALLTPFWISHPTHRHLILFAG